MPRPSALAYRQVGGQTSTPCQYPGSHRGVASIEFIMPFEGDDDGTGTLANVWIERMRDGWVDIVHLRDDLEGVCMSYPDRLIQCITWLGQQTN